MKNIKDTTWDERAARYNELKKYRRDALIAYIKAKIALDKIDLELTQIENADNGHFIEMEDE